MHQLTKIFLLCAGLWLAATSSAWAQGQDRQITFTGFITGGKNSEALPGAYIYIPKAGHGVLAANNGYFALPVLPGDSVWFSYVGYKKQYLVIPQRVTDLTYSALIELREDVTLLSEVKVYPYPTEELFKQALVNMRLPDERERENLARNTSAEAMARLAAVTPMGATANHQMFMNQQFFGRENILNRSNMTMFSFTNPFAWANFIRSIKRGDFKAKDYRKDLNQAPPENVRRGDLLRN